MLKLALVAALVAAASAQTKEELEKKYLEDLAALERDKRGASISTDPFGNININTKTNGDMILNRRESETIKISDMLNDISNMEVALGKMQENAALYTSAQGFMSNLSQETIKVTTDIKVTQATQGQTLTAVEADVKEIKDNTKDTLDDLEDKVDTQLQSAQTKMDTAIKKANDQAAAAKIESAKALVQAQENIMKSVNATLKSMNNVVTAVKASKLYWPQPFYKLIDYHVTKQGARGAGRVFYKVEYNPGSATFFNQDRRELKQACAALSADLKAMDGIDRRLKPACDNPSYCDSGGVSLPNSYLSHTGCGGYNIDDRGYGLPHSFVDGVIMYNRLNSWHGCHMLQHRGYTCSHQWVHCWGSSTNKATATLCTGSNNQFTKAPPK